MNFCLIRMICRISTSSGQILDQCAALEYSSLNLWPVTRPVNSCRGGKNVGLSTLPCSLTRVLEGPVRENLTPVRLPCGSRNRVTAHQENKRPHQELAHLTTVPTCPAPSPVSGGPHQIYLLKSKPAWTRKYSSQRKIDNGRQDAKNSISESSPNRHRQTSKPDCLREHHGEEAQQEEPVNTFQRKGVLSCLFYRVSDTYQGSALIH